MRRTRIRARSDKAAVEAVERRRAVDEYLRRHPVCEWPQCRRDAVDVHEPLTRARGGSILDPDNMRAVCREHHRWIHDHPAEATARGWLVPSWER